MPEVAERPKLTSEEAQTRIERAFRVKFDKDPGQVEQVMITSGSLRVAQGESFRWEAKGNQPLLKFGLEGEESDEQIEASDILALEAEELSHDVSVAKNQIERAVSAKEAQFCRFVAAGDKQSTAYMKAGYNAATMNSAYVCASQLMKRPRIAAYLRSLRESTWVANVLSLAEKRAYLADVVRTPVGEIDEKSPLCQSFKVDPEGKVEYKTPDKLKALELDAKLAGELKEGQVSVNASFSFGFLDDGIAPEMEADAREIPPQSPQESLKE